MNLSEKKFDGSNLIFIIGAPRSGTTWLQRLLASHPRIKTGHESKLFEYVGRPLRTWKHDVALADGQGLPGYLTSDEFMSLTKNYLDSLLAAMTKDFGPDDFFLEKTPLHTAWVSEILEMLPRARMVHLVRDPRDVVASLLAASKGWGSRWAPREAKKAAKLWAMLVKTAEQACATLPSDQFLQVSYEDLCRETAGELQKIFRFLNLPWTEEEIVAAVKANTADQLRKEKGTPIPARGERAKKKHGGPTNTDGFVRKARPGAWREDLNFLQQVQVANALGKEMPDWKKHARA